MDHHLTAYRESLIKIESCADLLQLAYKNHPGHYEVVLVEYDPSKTSYEILVEYAWRNLDPFDGFGQFCDKGSSKSKQNHLPSGWKKKRKETERKTDLYFHGFHFIH